MRSADGRPAAMRRAHRRAHAAGCVDAAARTAACDHRVPRRRHRDQRQGRRGLRADRGRRGARRRRRAARPLGDARRRRRAAVARDPALHLHHAGNGRRGAGGRRRFARPRGADRIAARARARRPQRRVRPPRPAPGVRARGAGLAGPADAVHRRARAPLRPARAPAAARRAGRRARRGGPHDAPRAGRRRDLRARVLRAVRAPLRTRAHGRRRARDAEPRPPAAAAARRAHHRPDRRDQAPQGGRDQLHVAARRARRLHLPQRRRAGALHRQVRRAAHPRALALRDLGAVRGLDGAGGARRPPHDELRAGRARARAPAHQGAAPAWQRRPQARRRVRLPALPAGHRLPGDRGRARARRRARGDGRPAAQPCRRGRAQGAARLALRPAPLRPQAAPAAVAVGLRSDGTLHVALPQRPRPQPLPPQARRGSRAVHRHGRRGRGAAGPHRRADARRRRRAAVRAGCLAAPPP